MAEERPFEPITTQEQLDAVVRDRVRRAKERAVEPYADYDELKARAEAAERAAGEADELRRRADEAEGALARAREERERESARARVSEETGVPARLISGDDEGSMRESAAALAEWARPGSAVQCRGGHVHHGGHGVAVVEGPEQADHPVGLLVGPRFRLPRHGHHLSGVRGSGRSGPLKVLPCTASWAAWDSGMRLRTTRPDSSRAHGCSA